MKKYIILGMMVFGSLSTYADSRYFQEVEAGNGPCIASVFEMGASVVCNKNRKLVSDSGYSNAFLVLLGEMQKKGYSLKGNCFESSVNFVKNSESAESSVTCIFE